MIRPGKLTGETPRADGFRPDDVWATFQAAASGDTETLRRLLATAPGCVHVEYAYTSPLQVAVEAGQAAAAEVLLAAGASPAGVVSHGCDLPTVARDRGDEALAEVLEGELERRAQAVPEREDHPLHLAAVAGDLVGVEAILAAEPGLIERRDRRGGTPLHRAVAAGRQGAIELLLDRGADLHARHADGPGAPEGYAPAGFEAVDLALWRDPYWSIRDDTASARLLVARGATYDLIVASALGDAEAVASMLDEDPDGVSTRRPSGKGALSAAVDFGHERIVEMLLARGADPNAADGPNAPHGSALHAAARAGNRTLVELLLAHGADPNAVLDSSGSATYAAASREIRELLQERGGVLDAYDLVWLDEDAPALELVGRDPAAAETGCGGIFAAACTLGKRTLVESLLAAGIRVPPVVTGCRSYLWSRPELLELLLESGMDPDLPDWRHATPLHDLCSRDARGRPRPHRVVCAELLIAAGAHLTATEETYRSTPLGWAARHGLPDMVRLLLAHGASATMPDDEPWATPIAWADRRGHAEILSALRRADA